MVSFTAITLLLAFSVSTSALPVPPADGSSSSSFADSLSNAILESVDDLLSPNYGHGHTAKEFGFGCDAPSCIIACTKKCLGGSEECGGCFHQCCESGNAP